jgi:hypothetical protein
MLAYSPLLLTIIMIIILPIHSSILLSVSVLSNIRNLTKINCDRGSKQILTALPPAVQCHNFRLLSEAFPTVSSSALLFFTKCKRRLETFLTTDADKETFVLGQTKSFIGPIHHKTHQNETLQTTNMTGALFYFCSIQK